MSLWIYGSVNKLKQGCTGGCKYSFVLLTKAACYDNSLGIVDIVEETYLQEQRREGNVNKNVYKINYISIFGIYIIRKYAM